jgi:1-acyl-sn-glycerol-3-phosphate acyltransferase
LRNVLGRIWAFWGLIWFVSSLFVAILFYLPCFGLKEPSKAKWHRIVSQIWMRAYLFIIGCSIKTIGRENYQLSGNYIVVCNHNSLMDVPVSTPFLPKPNKTIAKKSFTRIPLFGWVYSFGSVLVDRRSEESRRKSFDAMKHILDIGLDMLIYPEGTRNKTSEPLKSFYDGAFKLSIETQKPIVPVVLWNSKKMLPAKPIMDFKPGKIIMNILPAVYPQGHSIDSLKKTVYDIMANFYLENEK